VLGSGAGWRGRCGGRGGRRRGLGGLVGGDVNGGVEDEGDFCMRGGSEG
jgi:hypothetical protein